MKKIIPVVFLLLLTACSNSATAVPATEAGPAPTLPVNADATLPPLDVMPATPALREILSVSKIGPGSSEPFVLSELSMIRVNWQQSSSGPFELAILNADPTQADTPYGKVVFESTTGPSARFSDYEFMAGQYTVVVEKADGPWNVWVEYVGP
jgi:hypothetical protein